jgi:hypothetical protein
MISSWKAVALDLFLGLCGRPNLLSVATWYIPRSSFTSPISLRRWRKLYAQLRAWPRARICQRPEHRRNSSLAEFLGKRLRCFHRN